MTILVTLLSSSLLALAVAPAPRVAVAETVRDLGVRAPGEDAVALFTFRNGGEAPLVLRAGRVSGGGAQVKLPDPVPPGGSGQVRVVVDTWSVAGSTTVSVPVLTNDEAQPVVALEIHLDVQVAVVAEPGYARYIFVQTAPEGTVPQRLRAVDGRPFGIVEVRSSHPFLRATAGGKEPAAEQVVAVTLLPEAPVGALAAEVVVVLDHPRQKEVRIPVSGFVRPVFAATPPDVKLGEVRAGHVTRVGVRNFLDAPLRLGPVDADFKGVDARVEEVAAGESWVLTVTVRPDAPVGPLAGTLRIRTTSPDRPVVEVPYAARVVNP